MARMRRTDRSIVIYRTRQNEPEGVRESIQLDSSSRTTRAFTSRLADKIAQWRELSRKETVNFAMTIIEIKTTSHIRDDFEDMLNSDGNLLFLESFRPAAVTYYHLV